MDLNYQIEKEIFNKQHHISDEEKQIIFFLTYIFSCISIFFSVFIVFLYWFFKDLKKFHFEVIMWLSVSNTLSNATCFMKTNTLYSCLTYCYISSLLDISSRIWSILSIYTAIKSILVGEDIVYENKVYLRLKFFIIAFVIPILIAIPIIFLKVKSSVGYICTFNMDDYSTGINTKIRIIYYFILWYLVIINLYMIIKFNQTINLVSKQFNMFKYSRITSIFSQVKFYPIILFVTLIPGTITLIYYEIYNKFNFAILIIQVILEGSQGLLIALCFLLTPYLRSAISLIFKRIFKCERNAVSIKQDVDLRKNMIFVIEEEEFDDSLLSIKNNNRESQNTDKDSVNSFSLY